MNEAVGQSAASPQDVIAQDSGQPTAAQGGAQDSSQMAASGATTPAAGADSGSQQMAAADQAGVETNPMSGGEPVDMKAVLLARAQAYQELGNEDACMNVVEQAKQITQ
jgi:hypothetical protein